MTYTGAHSRLASGTTQPAHNARTERGSGSAVMREHGGPARDQPPDQHHARSDHRRERRHAGQHPEPVRGDGHHRIQQCVPVDDQQHVPHDVHQGGDAEHQHADEHAWCARSRADGPVCVGVSAAVAGACRRGPPSPSAGSRRSAGWGPGTVAASRRAVRRRGAPLSTGSRAAAAAACAASRAAADRAGRRWAAARAPPRVGRGHVRQRAPSARRGSGGTTRVAVRARSTECRTGSTPGSPDQRSPGDVGTRDQRGARRDPPATRTIAHGYPQFPQVYPQRYVGTHASNTASTGCHLAATVDNRRPIEACHRQPETGVRAKWLGLA